MGRYDWEGREGRGMDDDRERARRWRPGADRWAGEPRDEWWREPRDERWAREPMDDRWRHEPREERWRHEAGEERWHGRREEIDPPWVERGPARRGRDDTRGLVEWEDRGPLEWLGAKARDATGRPRAPKGYTRSDDRIRDEVCERLARCGADVGDVEVKVEGGEVTLSGTVWSREAKWRLEQVADDVFGVQDVHNGLRIARPGGERGAAPGTAGGRDDPHAAH